MANKICTHCKTENSETSNFCRKCGFVLPGGSTEFLSDKTFVSKIKYLQDKVNEIETESKYKDNELLNLASEKSALRQSVSKLQAENGNLRTCLSSANKRTDTAEQEVKKAKSDLSKKKSSRTLMHFLYIILVAAASTFGIVQWNNNQNKDSKISSLSDILEEVGRDTPIFLIGDVSVRNEGEEYGSTIYSGRTTYINPKVKILSLIDGRVDISVKFYTPDGLSTGSKSWGGYSYSNYFDMSKNQSMECEFSRWGRKDEGYWRPGNYRFEFYYQGKCIGSKSFTIY